ncbi:membrane protein [Paenibacillus sp. J31TS4]|uniref:carbohydrate ABC transporter permease n=1 Tax=Paenibacillus sp. J31TS4 TaxID=2807195 RepID=UPI001B001C35|nr:carbohydrate ABC transporter permease [Paenibacillus sp. J31TS4]GIP40819.1 membrane protein [Paenibacillus sp. J31TS4]
MQRTLRRNKALVTAAAYALLAVLVFPYLVMLLVAFKSKAEVYSIPPTFLPINWTLSNFVDIWSKVPLADYLLNTLTISGGATVLTLLCAIPAGYVLARMRFAGKRFYLYLIVVTQMFSPIVLLVGLFREIQWFGLMDSVWGLVLTNAAFNQAFAVWILSGYFATIPYELEQAAWLDGCTKWQALRRVTLPLALPGIITTVIFVFIAAWNEFAVALTFITTETNKPLTVGIYAFFGMYDVQWQYVFATSLVAIVPVVILFLCIEKYLISGLTAGGVKH